MHPFRVFISYSHEDRQLADQVVDVLKNELSLVPILDKDIGPGSPFSDAIRGMISQAHIFMPIITKNSQRRPWVHQETGYAMAINIPVLPIAIKTLPKEMTAQLQAIIVKPDFSDLADRLKEVNIEQVVIPPPARPASVVEVADWPETRTELIAQYANRVVEAGQYGAVRQRGALSSFCLPDKDVDDPVWKARDGRKPRSRFYHLLQREERRALEVHARSSKEGCRLIIDPGIVRADLSKLGHLAVRTRLQTLTEFLHSMDDSKVQLVISPKARGGNILIVGDWFVAESLVPLTGEGYRQTVFSSHAPTVLKQARAFDREFDELYRASGVGERASRKYAISEINKIMNELPDRADKRVSAKNRRPRNG